MRFIKRISQRTVINLIFILALITFGVIGLISHGEINRLVSSNWWVNHSYQVIERVTRSQLDLKNAKSQVIDYVILNSQQNTQQSPSMMILASMDSAEQHIRAAQQLTLDNPDQEKRLEKLALLIKAKRVTFQNIIHTPVANYNEALQFMINPKEQAMTAAITNLCTEITQHERTLLNKRDIVVSTDTKRIISMLIAATIATELLLLFCLLLLNLNLSKRDQAEKSLEASVGDLKRSNIELEQFAYVASHDLQEPLRMVVSYTQLLERRYKDKLDADASEFINYAVDGAKRMQVLLNNLLLYSRVNRQDIAIEKIDYNKIYNDTLLNIEALLSDKKCIITHGPLPIVYADGVQMTQLLQNLLSNSIKFTPKNRTPKIHVSAKKEKNEWVFSVKDNGIGIDLQYFDKIFIIFKRLHTRTEYPGTGIGLALCKKIVERHGGRIWLNSKIGKGTTFYFTLPTIKER